MLKIFWGIAVNEEEYKLICESCDRLLLAPNVPPERVAISWLHVIREHPVFLKAYQSIFIPSLSNTVLNRIFFYEFRYLCIWLLHILKSIFSEKIPWAGSRVLPQRTDVLFVSHLLNETQAEKADDFYFHNLPRILADSGKTVVVSLINHTGKNCRNFKDIPSKDRIPKVIFSESLGLFDEISMFFQLRSEYKKLKLLTTKEENSLNRRVIDRASLEVLSSATRANLLLSKQIGRLVSVINPKVIVITYEGHAWERLAFFAARTHNKNIKCVAYQHAALFRLQHSIKRNLEPNYNPDIILTSGNYAKKKLDDLWKNKFVPISVLGTSRIFDKSLSKEEYKKPIALNEIMNKKCLVVPEGIYSETKLILEFSIECARLCPELSFVWRLHPVISMKRLRKCIKLGQLPRNIQLSNLSLDEDIKSCDAVLYRGSTVAVQSAVAGLELIYLHVPGEMTIDPLYEIEDLRSKVETPAQFVNLFLKTHGFSLKKSQSELHSIKKFSADIFQPLNYKLIQDIIDTNY